MITIFTLLAFISLVAFLNSKTNKKWLIFGLHILAFTTALYTKEVAAFFPFIAAVYIVVIRKEKLFTPEKILLAVCWLIIGLIWFNMRNAAIKVDTNPDLVGLEAYIANLPTILCLIGKIFFPYRMSAVGNFDSLTMSVGAIVLVAIIVLIATRKNMDRRNILLVLCGF